MSKQQRIEPQPEKLHSGWLLGELYFADDEQMKSHLFHEVYGATGSPLGSVYSDHSDPANLMGIDIKLIDNEWMWIATYANKFTRVGINHFYRRKL